MLPAHSAVWRAVNDPSSSFRIAAGADAAALAESFPEQSGAHTIPSEILDSIAAWAAALCAAICVERHATRSCMRCWLNSSMARRAYSDLLKPARLASTAMRRAKSLGMRSEKVANDS